MKTVKVSVAGILLLAAASACSLDVGPREQDWFKAELESIPEPPIEYAGALSAGLVILLIEDGRLFYDVYLHNVEAARTATLHIGGTQDDTPAIATLWTSSDSQGETGTRFVMRGELLPASEITGATHQQVLDAIRDGNAYAVLTTVAHPSGAFRGPVVPAT